MNSISAPAIIIIVLIAAVLILVINYQEVPSGTIVMWSGETAPSGWSLCDGTNGTPDLRGRFILSMGAGIGLTPRAYGTTGGAETHTLTVEELPGHTHTGTTSSNGAHVHSINDSGHAHTQTTINDDFNNSGGNYGGSYTTPSYPPSDSAGSITWTSTINSSTTGITVNSNGAHTHTFTTDSTGSGTAHNNMPPFYVLAYIMKL